MEEKPLIPRDWYARSFNELYPIIYAHRTVEAAQPEAECAAGLLALEPDDDVLDLCCGNGRHMAHLAGRVKSMAGLDFSADLLRLARGHLQEGPGWLVRGDMRSLPFGEQFDVVTNFFTSFGYFVEDEENFRVMGEVGRVLRPGGRFLMDYLNPEYVQKTLVPESVKDYKGYRIEERRWIDDTHCRVNKATKVLRADALVAELGESVRLYSFAEMEAGLSEAGLAVDRVVGDFSGAPFDGTHARMILVGHKD